MKKILVIMLIMVLVLGLLAGCSSTTIETEGEHKESSSKTSMFIEVEQTNSWKVVYHRDTKVMYVISCGNYNWGTFCLLVDADGKPLLWDAED